MCTYKDFCTQVSKLLYLRYGSLRVCSPPYNDGLEHPKAVLTLHSCFAKQTSLETSSGECVLLQVGGRLLGENDQRMAGAALGSLCEGHAILLQGLVEPPSLLATSNHETLPRAVDFFLRNSHLTLKRLKRQRTRRAWSTWIRMLFEFSFFCLGSEFWLGALAIQPTLCSGS